VAAVEGCPEIGTPRGPDLFANPFRFPKCPFIKVFGRVGAAGWLVHRLKTDFRDSLLETLPRELLRNLPPGLLHSRPPVFLDEKKVLGEYSAEGSEGGKPDTKKTVLPSPSWT